MAVPPDIRDHAYKLFTQEVPELLQAIEFDLLTLTQEHSPTRIHNLMRTAHSIKGGAASVGLDVIASLAHRLENIFKALYSETLEMNTQLESQLLRAFDCLRLPLMQQVVTGKFNVDDALNSAEPIFAQLEDALGEFLKQIDHYDIPTSAQLGVDMTLSILEIDVSEQLDRLTHAIATDPPQQIEEKLRSQLDVFIELAEILNKPGLGAIAVTVLAAMNVHPNRVVEIAQLALENFQAYQEALLASAGAREIEPFATLMALTQQPLYSASANLNDANLNANHPGLSTTAWQYVGVEHSPTDEVVEPIVISSDFTNEPLTEKEILDELLSAQTNIDVTSSPVIEDAEFGTAGLSQILETLDDIQHQYTQTDEPGETPLTPISVMRSDTSSNPLSVTNTAQPTSSFSPPADSFQTISAHIHQDEIPIASQMTTRVDTEKLEQMNNWVNEAVIKRSSLSLHNEQIQKSVRDLLNRFSTVEQLVAQLRKVSDRTLIQDARVAHPLAEGIKSLSKTQADFDSLELDNYGTLHSLLQRFLEDIIQLRESADDIALFTRRSDRSLTELRKSLSYLQDDFMWVRMLPIGEVLNRFPRMLRDFSITYQKPIKLLLTGKEVLVDRAVIERIYDPLLHLLRNAFDHGIEPPEIRRQRDKPEQGLIEINAFHRGGQTVIEVKDDGQGLNLERIGRRAVELGILTPQQRASIPDDRLFNLIFEPGFSTAPQVSELSGRGVGLDVVRTQLGQLKGTISVTSQTGVGTTFTLRLPLTLTSDKLLICLAGFTALALPSDTINEIFVPRAEQVIKVGEQWFLQWRNEVFPIYRLTDLLEYEGIMPEAPPLDALITQSATSDPKSFSVDERRTLIVINWRQKYAALEVDQLITEQKLVIKPFGTMIAPPSCIYGCTILGDGSIVPVVDGAALIDEALERSSHRKGLPGGSVIDGELQLVDRSSMSLTQAPDSTPARSLMTSPKILVVDDAVALRQTLAMTLESVGYRVLQAGDGWEAIRQLQFNPDTALVISDIEMPNMNGFDFMNYRRQNPALEKIPLFILTSRSNDKHRRLAMHLGATAYFTKPYIEQGFLKEIQTVLEQTYSPV